MHNTICYNGDFISAGTLHIPLSNRSLRFGDGLFETIFIADGKPAFFNLHYHRLSTGTDFLGIEMQPAWTEAFLFACIEELAARNQLHNARCRFFVWRGGAGLYAPETNAAEMVMELFPSEYGDYTLNTKGITIGVYEDALKSMDRIAEIKSANALISVLAAKYAREQKYDDVVVLNTDGRIAEATGSNIFLYKDKKLFTPSLTEGCISGVMRKVVIALCRKEGIEVVEGAISVKELAEAEEVFLTNAITGIRWVQTFRNARYQNSFATDLIYSINEAKNNHALVSP